MAWVAWIGQVAKKNDMIEQTMNPEDELFKDIQALSDEADTLGLMDVAMVLEFAMDVFLRETGAIETPEGRAQTNVTPKVQKTKSNTPKEAVLRLKNQDQPLGWSMSNVPLAQVRRRAS